MDHSESPKSLEVYYHWSFGSEPEPLLEKCLRVHLETKHPEYSLVKLQRFDFDEVLHGGDRISPSLSTIFQTQDVIKKGLLTFNYMYRFLKLKTVNEVWFIYVGNGDVQELYKDVSVVLWNNQPADKRCRYTIYEDALHISNEMSRDHKLEGLKTFNKMLSQVFTTDKTIKYYRLT
jgi:hypothetical protein